MGWSGGNLLREGFHQGVELSELRIHLVSLLGNKEEPEPKAKGWFSEKMEGGTSTPPLPIHFWEARGHLGSEDGLCSTRRFLEFFPHFSFRLLPHPF